MDPKLNSNQREVIKRILAPGNTSSPVVVFGPFGTGKTFTLNQAIRQLVTKKHNRILLCTHTNSAADIHVRLLHDYLKKENALKATRPLRIYHTERRSVNFENVSANQAGFRKKTLICSMCFKDTQNVLLESQEIDLILLPLPLKTTIIRVLALKGNIILEPICYL